MRLQQYLNEGVYDKGIFKAIFLAGGSGSGKSYVRKNVGLTSFGLRIINSDDAYEHILKKSGLGLDLSKMSPEDYEKSQELRDVAKRSTEIKKGLSVYNRLGLIIDGTARNYESVQKQKQTLESLGYDTYMVFVNVPLDVALQRNQKRERTVDLKVATDAWQHSQYNIGKYQSLFGAQNFMVFDNVSPDKDDFDYAFKGIKKFIEKPIHNPLAKKWISRELEIRKGIK